jgi:hypothetical protein
MPATAPTRRVHSHFLAFEEPFRAQLQIDSPYAIIMNIARTGNPRGYPGLGDAALMPIVQIGWLSKAPAFLLVIQNAARESESCSRG